MSQGQKDFLALSHGQEWVSFYESFDKLVQDNLSRSSELLRRAMSLPEVADREVQQIRSEMDERIKEEREKQRELLGALQQDLSGSHRQVSMLARGVGAVIGDLERLGQRVNEAIASLETVAQAEPATPAASNGVSASTNGVAAAYVAPVAQPVIVEPPVVIPDEAPVAETNPVADFELPQMNELDSEFNVDDIAAAVQEQAAMLDAAEDKLDDLESAIDLTALAEAEGASAESDEAATIEAEAPVNPEAAAAGDRPRPHWLSVTRVGARS